MVAFGLCCFWTKNGFTSRPRRLTAADPERESGGVISKTGKYDRKQIKWV
jgi:hypothetical protein